MSDISNKDLLDVLLAVKEDVAEVREKVSALRAQVKEIPRLEEDVKALNAKVNRAHGGIALLMFLVTVALAVAKFVQS